MIINLPTQDDYNRIAKQCLVQAFNIVYGFYTDAKDNDGYVDVRLLWQYRSGEMSTSLILIHQAIESLMKGAICSASPFLLIDAKRHEWPTLPTSSDKDFNDLYTIGGAALVHTYFSIVGKDHSSAQHLTSIEEVRVIRNKIVHGVSREDLYPSYLISIILATYTMFLGQNSWWETTKSDHLNSPISHAYEDDYLDITLVDILDYVEGIVPKGTLPQHFKLNTKSRRYFCPWCFDNARMYDRDLESKWAFLVPQGQPQVTTVYCIICDRANQVKRTSCNNVLDKCKGDVIYKGEDGWITCLTCGEIQND